MYKTISIQVKGRVQGVFYRKYIFQKAKELGLTGFVRNTDNGEVYIEATGNNETLSNFTNYCKQGSPASNVTGLNILEIPYETYKQFLILR